MSTLEQRQELVNRIGVCIAENAELVRAVMFDRDEFIMGTVLDMEAPVDEPNNLIYVKLFGE